LKSRQWIGFLYTGLVLLLAGCQSDAPPNSTVVQPGKAPTEAGIPTPFKPEEPTATYTVVVTPTLTPIPCEMLAGQVVEYQIESEGFTELIVFRVYEPPCYGSPDHGSFPVLYMLHGQTFTDDQWQRLGLAETANHLIAAGVMAPYLIVMPLEHDTFTDIYASEFSRTVIDVMIPWVDTHYDTCVERECRAIGGLSRGGAWAIHLGFSNWWLFSAIGAHSTPPFNGDLYRLQGWVDVIAPDQLPRVYMDIGRSDIFRPYAAELETTLTNLQVPHEWVIPEGDHSESYWSTNQEDYLMWYGLGWLGTDSR
jgi:enterochelin esterase-like enzyme